MGRMRVRAMKRSGLLAAAILAAALCGSCNRAFVPTRKNVVGRYVFHAADRGLRHPADTLTLGDDGTYTLQQLVGHASVRQTGRWTFVRGSPPEVRLDSIGYPVRAAAHTIEVLVDPDLGFSFVKAR